MLLVELTINGNIRRISNEPLALAYWWAPAIASMSSIRISLPKAYGGYYEPEFGSIDFTPDLFDGDWPPPLSCPITVKVATAGAADAVTILEGTAHRSAIGRDGIIYELYGSEFAATITAPIYLDTLTGIFTTHCLTLGLTLNTAGTARNPAVDYSAAGERILINDLSDIAAFFSHCFYVAAGVLYLVDMLTDNGSSVYTEYDIFPSSCSDPQPLSMLVAQDNVIAGPYKYGSAQSVSPVCHTVTADIDAALINIKTIIERPTVELYKPLSDPPGVGERVQWLDNSMHKPLNVWARTRSIVWNFDDELCIISGEGGVSA